MRVFLDSNVALTGAFNLRGPAGTLGALRARARFVYSRQVLTECDYLIGRDAPSMRVAQVAGQILRSYLASLGALQVPDAPPPARSEEHTSELPSLMRISYAVFCLKKKRK